MFTDLEIRGGLNNEDSILIEKLLSIPVKLEKDYTSEESDLIWKAFLRLGELYEDRFVDIARSIQNSIHIRDAMSSHMLKIKELFYFHRSKKGMTDTIFDLLHDAKSWSERNLYYYGALHDRYKMKDKE